MPLGVIDIISHECWAGKNFLNRIMFSKIVSKWDRKSKEAMVYGLKKPSLSSSTYDAILQLLLRVVCEESSHHWDSSWSWSNDEYGDGR